MKMLKNRQLIIFCACMMLPLVSGMFSFHPGFNGMFPRQHRMPQYRQRNFLNNNHFHPMARRKLRDNVKEERGAFKIFVEAPHDDFKVTVHDDLLRIRELYRGGYDRQFRLPRNVHFEQIFADFKNGILEVVIPKVVPRTIEKEILVGNAENFQSEISHSANDHQHCPSNGANCHPEASMPTIKKHVEHENPAYKVKTPAYKVAWEFSVDDELDITDVPFTCEDCLTTSDESQCYSCDLKPVKRKWVDRDGYSGYMYRGEFVRY
jgi:HSP20 family molecular chaperone IbpA